VNAPARKVLVATRNSGKARELRALLAPLGFVAVDLVHAGISETEAEDALETEATFEGNALAKARYFAGLSGARPVLADDSGLCVAALGGAPGVRSRRYAGALGGEAVVSAANSAKLLRELANVEDRSAEFCCAVAYVAGEHECVATGRVGGRILTEGRGSGGFGYDPLFWSDELGRTFAEASDVEKARVSHRARAIAQLAQMLSRSGAESGAR
jgi:XTP/dITP diphosphohydrolase